jgi:hypothetical protein
MRETRKPEAALDVSFTLPFGPAHAGKHVGFIPVAQFICFEKEKGFSVIHP